MGVSAEGVEDQSARPHWESQSRRSSAGQDRWWRTTWWNIVTPGPLSLRPGH